MRPEKTIEHFVHLLLENELHILGGQGMILRLERFSDNNGSTLGTLKINNVFECFSLEDPYRKDKIKKITRIPAGTYEVELRKEGSANKKYKERYRDMHKGMLHLKNVPGFKYILIHVGNYKEDTEGCILVGEKSCSNRYSEGKVLESRDAYERLYPKVRDVLVKGGFVAIEITDNDREVE